MVPNLKPGLVLLSQILVWRGLIGLVKTFDLDWCTILIHIDLLVNFFWTICKTWQIYNYRYLFYSYPVAYRGVKSCVRRTSGKAREVSAAGAIFLQGVWGPHRPRTGPGQSPGTCRRFRGASPPDRKRF